MNVKRCAVGAPAKSRYIGRKAGVDGSDLPDRADPGACCGAFIRTRLRPAPGAARRIPTHHPLLDTSGKPERPGLATPTRRGLEG